MDQLIIALKFKCNRKMIKNNYLNNKNCWDSMNNGIEYTSGQYIGIVEPDDFSDIYMFENLYKYTKNNGF